MSSGSSISLAKSDSRFEQLIRNSAVPYLATTAIGVLAARFSSYIFRDGPLIKAQSPEIYTTYLFFGLAFVLWILYRGSRSRAGMLNLVYLLTLVFWVVRISLTYVHENNFNHLVWLVPLLLVMLYFKAPTWQDLWSTVLIMAITMAIMMLAAYILELLDFVQPFPKPEGRNDWESSSYWLPFEGLFGQKGRWTGPFGHNRTALVGAFVLIISIARWTKWSWFLIPIGIFFTLLTSVRGPLLALIAGLAILVLFSSLPLIRQIPMVARWVLLVVGVGLVGVFYVLTGTGLTGRDQIWSGYIDQGETSLITGVGQYGLDLGNDGTIDFLDAHNIFVDEFSRNGLLGLMGLLLVIGLSLWLMLKTANHGFAGPLAVMVTYLVASSSDIHADGLHMSFIVVMTLLATACAGTYVTEKDLESDQTLEESVL